MDSGKVLAGVRLLPVVVIDHAAQAIPLAETLTTAGIEAIEITLRTDAGLAAIEAVADAVANTGSRMLVGAGSVVNVQQLKQVQDAGACFAVSPGHTDRLLEAAEGFPYVPGAATAAECMHLLSHGYRLQKFFPAESSGGVKTINALAAPMPELRFCVTGGITPANVADYLACPAVSCIGGSWFVPAQSLQAGDFETIGRLARDAVALTRS